MVTVNMNLPDNCMDCKLGYDCCRCIITGRTFDFSTCEDQRMDDCPLAIYHGLPQWHNDCFIGGIMDNKEIEKEIYFARTVIGVIDHVERPMLVYDEEKKVVKKALQEYIYDLETKQRGR